MIQVATVECFSALQLPEHVMPTPMLAKRTLRVGGAWRLPLSFVTR